MARMTHRRLQYRPFDSSLAAARMSASGVTASKAVKKVPPVYRVRQ